MKKILWVILALSLALSVNLYAQLDPELYSWWCGDPAVEGYDNQWLQFLTTEEIDLPSSPSGNLILSFQSFYNVEPAAEYEDYDSWDGMNVRISTDGGGTFQIIEPVGGYPYESMYGFGYNGEGIGVPGWGGESDGWENPIFILNDFIGQTVNIRFAFGSDPAYCTINYGDGPGTWDPDMFGWVIDDITVRDDDDIFFFNAAGDTSAMYISNALIAYGDYWAMTTEEAYSPTHSWNCEAGHPNLWCALVSPVIEVPTASDSLVVVEYMVLCDFEDLSGSGEGLDDYMMMFVSPDSGETFYWLNGVCKSGIYEVDTFSIVNQEYAGNIIRTVDSRTIYGTAEVADSIRSSGQLQFYFIVYTDDNDDMGVGEGIFIDDFRVIKSMAVHQDIMVSSIGSTPTNFDTDITFAVQIYNNGLDPIASIPTFFKIYYYDPDGDSLVLDASGLFSPFPSLSPGEHKTLRTTWTSDVPGEYHFVSYSALGSDEVHENDTMEYVFNVYSEDTVEIGYDDGEYNAFDDEGHVAYLIGSDLGGFDYAAVHCTSPFHSYSIMQVKWYCTSSVPILVQILSSIDDTPGDLIAADSIYDPVPGGWQTADIGPFEIDETDFFIAFSAFEESTGFAVYADTSSPIDERSWLNSSPDLYNLGTIDFMIRAVVTTGATRYAFSEPREERPLSHCELFRGPKDPSNLLRIRTFHPMIDEDTLYFTEFEDGEAGWWHFDFTYEASLNTFWHPDTFMHYTAIGEKPQIPYSFSLRENYPNPFNAVTTISYSLAENCLVTLDIYDVLGKKVCSLVNEAQGAGAYRVMWEGNNDRGESLPAGVYLYHLSTDKFEATDKMLLLK
ncbi:T9SS type A sorting domain-containing protein [bacterium]|nr:T9SS type A sorting domain-containing protein [bacterium]